MASHSILAIIKHRKAAQDNSILAAFSDDVLNQYVAL